MGNKPRITGRSARIPKYSAVAVSDPGNFYHRETDFV